MEHLHSICQTSGRRGNSGVWLMGSMATRSGALLNLTCDGRGVNRGCCPATYTLSNLVHSCLPHCSYYCCLHLCWPCCSHCLPLIRPLRSLTVHISPGVQGELDILVINRYVVSCHPCTELFVFDPSPFSRRPSRLNLKTAMVQTEVNIVT